MGANAVTSVFDFTAGQVLTAAQMDNVNCGVPVFATTTTRDAAFGGTGEKVLAEGQYAYTEDTNTLWVYDGSAWVGGINAASLNAVGTAYITYTPTVTAQTGTYTSTTVSGRYTLINKVCIGTVSVTITTNGTAAGATLFTLPFAVRNVYSSGDSIGYGREAASTGVALNVESRLTNSAAITNYVNAYAGGSGTRLSVNFIYEVA